MAEYTANASQTVEANQNVLFTETPVPGCRSIVHREGSGLITLRGLTSCQCRARFKVTFGGNIALPTTGTEGTVSMAIAISGEAVGSSSMVVTLGSTGAYLNIGSSLYLDVPAGCCMTISVKNTSNQALLVQNANIIVERVA